MKTLTPTLAAAQASRQRRPHVEAAVRDYHQGIARLAWHRLYTGAEPDGRHGVAIDGAGNLHRIRVEGSNLYRQRQSYPFGVPTLFPHAFPFPLDNPADFSSWSYFAAGCAGPCAITADPNGSTVYIFWRTTGNVIAYRRSTNSGLTWSTAATLASYSNVLSMAAAWWSGGTGVNLVLFALRSNELSAFVWNSSTNTLVVQRTATFAPPHHTHTITATFGIGAVYDPRALACQVVFAGLQEDTPYNHYNVYRCELTFLHYFSGLQSFVRAHGEGQVTYEHPECYVPIAPRADEEIRITLVERFSGADPYDRPMISNVARGTSFMDTVYTEPKPFVDAAPAYGFRMASGVDYYWLSTPSGLWRARREPPPPVDIGPDIVGLTLRTHAVASAELASGPGTLVIELDNSRGQYAHPGQGQLASLRFRAELELKLGYRTPAGAEAVHAGTYWIDSWQYSSEPNISTFTIYALDGWSLANRWTPRHQMTWNAGPGTPAPVWDILYQLLGRIGIRLTSGPPRSPAVLNFAPEFTLVPGQRGDTAIRRLLAMVPDMLVFCGQEAFVKDPRDTEASCYAYGPGDHPISAGRYAAAVTTSRARAIGRHTVNVGGVDVEQPVIGDAIDWELQQLFDYLAVTYDGNLDDPALAEERAGNMLRSLGLRARPATITVPANVGQELLDVIEVTDPRCGIVSRRHRVQDIMTLYDRRKARYDQTITLGAP